MSTNHLWIRVVAIVLFCGFYYYYLFAKSLKDNRNRNNNPTKSIKGLILWAKKKKRERE